MKTRTIPNHPCELLHDYSRTEMCQFRHVVAVVARNRKCNRFATSPQIVPRRAARQMTSARRLDNCQRNQSLAKFSTARDQQLSGASGQPGKGEKFGLFATPIWLHKNRLHKMVARHTLCNLPDF